MEIPLGLIAAFLFLLIMAVMEGVAVSAYRILAGAPAPSYCKGKSFYTYNSFIAAADSFPEFGNGTSDEAKREVAAFLANVVDKSQEFCYIAQSNAQSFCNQSSSMYPCAKGKSYYARGPLGLTGNDNYGAAGNYLKLNLLGNPDKVSENSTISFQTAIWLWTHGSKSHTAIVSGKGFTATVKALNYTACNDRAKLNTMVENYKTYCNFFKVNPGSNLLSCDPDTATLPPSRRNPESLNSILLGSIGGTALVSCLVLFICWLRVRSRRYNRAGEGEGEREESRLVYFDYQMLREATKGFDSRNKLGQGGFGEVYKGILRDGTPIAVKKLFPRQSSQAVVEFHTEIEAISGVLHRNILRLLGYCSHRQKRFLVYEFMPNRSLDIHLFGERGIFLKWEARFQIITGIARGLAYLHEHSRVSVVHRDIKAANILLDDNLHPKIADFGLAKLFPDDRTHITTNVGGTIGYMAPEYVVHGHLTQKADVYSYGVLVLEILSGRKCMDSRLASPILLQWAWSLYERNESINIVDPKLELQGMFENEKEQVLRVVLIAFLCVQGVSSQRPSMSMVLTMLTGDSEILVAPSAPALIDCENISVASAAAPQAFSSSASSSTSHATMSNSMQPR